MRNMRIINEEHECILSTSDMRVISVKIVPELAIFDDTYNAEEKEKEEILNKTYK